MAERKYHVNLSRCLPPVVRNIKEFQILADMETPQAEKLWEALESALKDQFVQEATLNGIKRWEKMLALSPKDTDTLDNRRFRILARINESLPFTYRMLENQLALLCGKDRFTLAVVPEKYSLVIRMDLQLKEKFAEISALVHRISPANLLLDISLQFQTWKELKRYRYRYLLPYSWAEVKEKQMEIFTECQQIKEYLYQEVKNNTWEYVRKELYKK